eukprot:CAMPEP_0119475616 /NCGR_PEP_ID=MMETSP1344-20130328/6438_1 /TAXON_ID=236787 /ORGANISM="Florenciella parvula, Strain CCMP2471" /LENGTH=131 /DNA_ID=CAMNT_0007509177 /DNA_START=178 /DNA_END=573 /DNA_ORIENTATION=-
MSLADGWGDGSTLEREASLSVRRSLSLQPSKGGITADDVVDPPFVTCEISASHPSARRFPNPRQQPTQHGHINPLPSTAGPEPYNHSATRSTRDPRVRRCGAVGDIRSAAPQYKSPAIDTKSRSESGVGGR